MFLDPNKPLATCKAETCSECGLKESLHCHFRLKDLAQFLLVCLPSFLVGGYGIHQANSTMLMVWLALIVGFFCFVEIRVMCSHCPHYAEEGKTLQCWANYGSPKLWKYRPGPMSKMEKSVFFAGFALIWGFPIPFLLVAPKPFLLLIYTVSVAVFFLLLKKLFCSQCINFACPLNSVGDEIREVFFQNNPRIAEAWQDSRKKK